MDPEFHIAGNKLTLMAQKEYEKNELTILHLRFVTKWDNNRKPPLNLY